MPLGEGFNIVEVMIRCPAPPAWFGNFPTEIMSQNDPIPRKAVYRLSIYNRCLRRLVANGIETVSSSALAKAAGVKPAQLRRDLGHLGQLGTRGLGYSVGSLSEAISIALGRAKLQPVILVGVGNLGTALLRYDGFLKEGFELVMAFDREPEVVKMRLSDSFPVMNQEHMGDYMRAHQVRMAILAVPGEQAQSVANELVQAGVAGILNFSPVVLQVPEGVSVNNVDLALELEQLNYFVKPDKNGADNS